MRNISHFFVEISSNFGELIKEFILRIVPIK